MLCLFRLSRIKHVKKKFENNGILYSFNKINFLVKTYGLDSCFLHSYLKEHINIYDQMGKAPI